ncbi:hypothetical protein BJX61DRAFT_538213 [Aspergillus egyptiacus]|nr:hypothetical protein BJX61DRAFT_538213 [Aspergillus egyptiacus]
MAPHGDSLSSHQREWDENRSQSPDSKRRRTNPQLHFRPDLHRDRSPPGSPYALPPHHRRDSISARGVTHTMQAPRGLRPVREFPQPDPDLKLPPLQTTASMPGSVTPATPFSQDSFDVETAVSNIPFLNKIKLLAKISPPLASSFRERGPVIAVDGQDAALVKAVTEYLSQALQKEGKFQTHIFEGPEIQRRRERSSEPEDMSDKKIEYFTRISAWQRISEKIKAFVKSEPSRRSAEPGSGNEEDNSTPEVSPRTIIPKTADLRIGSPPQSSENGSESISSPPESTSSGALPVALVPRYQLTTADAYACMVPIEDSYGPLDHWQWMASLWRGNVGPDITVYIRECSMHEMKQFGGNPVEIRLQDAKTVVVRRLANSPKEVEEKTLKRLGFEIEDYLTQ